MASHLGRDVRSRRTSRSASPISPSSITRADVGVRAGIPVFLKRASATSPSVARVQRQIHYLEEEDELEQESPQEAGELSVGRSGTQEEAEAELAEEVVMRPPAWTEPASPLEEEEKEEPAQSAGSLVQAKRDPHANAGGARDLDARIESLKGRGAPLPERTRRFFEKGFGYDFRNVRVHADRESGETARALNARAFTVGQDVVFGPGQYAPATTAGRRLIAHELSHVVQQNAPAGRQRSRGGGLARVVEEPGRRGATVQSTILAKADDHAQESETAPQLASAASETQPLKLVFYQANVAADELGLFRRNAGSIASAIGAVRIPAKCPGDSSEIALPTGAMPLRGGIKHHLRRAHKCLSRRVSELHIVGHIHAGVSFSRKWIQAIRSLVAPDVRIVFHGCYVLDYRTGLKRLLKALGSEAEVIAHSTKGEAGRPIDFYQVTLPEGESTLEKKLVEEVTLVLPETYIRGWVARQTDRRLYRLLRAKRGWRLQEDVRGIVVEELTGRLRKMVRRWSLRRVELRARKATYDWQRRVFEERISELGSRMTESAVP